MTHVFRSSDLSWENSVKCVKSKECYEYPITILADRLYLKKMNTFGSVSLCSGLLSHRSLVNVLGWNQKGFLPSLLEDTVYTVESHFNCFLINNSITVTLFSKAYYCEVHKGLPQCPCCGCELKNNCFMLLQLFLLFM